MEITLSLIVPVYNVAPYLDECLTSILKQVKPDCEIILIDDGSTDGSGELCDKWSSEASCIRVLHKPNGGLSSARNAGLEIAEGKYIAFIDSDDRISGGSINRILDWIRQEGTDICFMQAIKFFPNGHTEDLGDAISRHAIYRKPKELVFDYLATRPKYPGSACTKIYRREFLNKENIRFPSDKRRSEDLGFVLQCLLLASSFDALDIPYYEYRQNRVGSITNVVDEMRFFDLALFIVDSTAELTNGNVPHNTIARDAMAFIAYEYSILLWWYARVNRKVKKRARIFLREYQWVMNYAASPKLKALRLLVFVTGIGTTAKILNAYMRFRKKES